MSDKTARVLFGTSESTPDIFWATGMLLPDPHVFVEIDGTKYLFTNTLEYSRAKEQARVDEVLKIEEYFDKGKELLGDVSEQFDTKGPVFLHAFFNDNEVNKLVVQKGFPPFPHDFGKDLEVLGYEIEFERVMFPERTIKQPHEIRAIEEAVRVTEAAIEIAKRILIESTITTDDKLDYRGEVVTSETLRKAMHSFFSENEFIAPLGTVIACGKQSAQPHNVGSGPIYTNELIVFDVFPRSLNTGYYADISRTFLKGTPTRQQKAMYVAVREAQKVATEILAPGVKWYEPHDISVQSLEDSGFKTDLDAEPPYGFIHSLGHGLGLEMHEDPHLGRPVQDKFFYIVDKPLVAGNIVTTEPGLYYPDIGGVRIEDTVLITEDGYRNLTTLTKGEWIIR